MCVCIYENSEASAYSFGLATNPNPTRARSYPLNINPKPDPKPEIISGPAGSGRVADLYHGSISKTVYTRQISKSSDLWLYVRSDTYIERLVLPTLFTKYTLLSPGDVTNPHFCEIYTSVERINRSYKIIDLT